MKKFIFPQIFIPILNEDEQHFSGLTNRTYRRIQTEADCEDNNFRTKHFSKTSRHPNFLVKSSYLSTLENFKQNKQLNQSQVNIKLNEIEQRSALKTHPCLQKSKTKMFTKSLFSQNKYKGVKANEKKQNSQLINKGQDKQNIVEYVNQIKMSNKQSVKKRKSYDKKSEQFIIRKSQQRKSKNSQKKMSKRSTISRLSMTESQRKESQQIKNQQTIQDAKQNNEQQQQVNQNKQQEQQVKNRTMNKLLKMIKYSSSRRNGVENAKYLVDFEMTDDMIKIVDNNIKIMQRPQYKLKHSVLEKSQEQIKKSSMKSSIKDKSIKNQNDNESQASDTIRKKFPIIQTCLDVNQGMRQYKLQKRSYTIWDIQSQHESEKSQNKQHSLKEQIHCQIQNQNINKDLNKKNPNQKKKVHFGRTSIRTKDEADQIFKKLRNGKDLQIDSLKKNLKTKNYIQRAVSDYSMNSIKQLPEQKPQILQNKKIYTTARTQMKKKTKTRKLQNQNAYDELNYIRLKLNITQDVQEQPQTNYNKPHIQTIQCTVQKVLHELDYQRIQNTKCNNMMIDFGVTMTKDCLLRQANARDKAILS